MLFSDVQGWLDRFEDEVCGKRKRIRGRTFDGIRLEVYADGGVAIVLSPAVEGESAKSRAMSLVKGVFDSRVLESFIPQARFAKIVAGEDEIREEDWVWDDEQ